MNCGGQMMNQVVLHPYRFTDHEELERLARQSGKPLSQELRLEWGARASRRLLWLLYYAHLTYGFVPY